MFGVFPPLKEQYIISDYINKQLTKFNELVNQAILQVKLLQERRTALISAAVTGKIDVRNWMAPTHDVVTHQEPQEATA
ncbi:hypothetical protein [Serratia silvae]|uniref:hypothetical protein n=1 Tax=Serratia silvae TaxID=2824122 RepID=UPI0039F05560